MTTAKLMIYTLQTCEETAIALYGALVLVV